MDDPGPGVPAGSTLSAALNVMNAEGTVVAATAVTFTAPDTLVRTAVIDDDEATRAALALAGRDGTWELICTQVGSVCEGTVLDHGVAHSTVSSRHRTRVPSGCCGGAKEPVIVPVPDKSKRRRGAFSKDFS